MSVVGKDQIWVDAPCAAIAVCAGFRGVIAIGELEEAVAKSLAVQGMYGMRVCRDQNGVSHYHPGRVFPPHVHLDMRPFREILQEQETKPFHLDEGELFRFFATPFDGGYSLLVIAHHLAGDGLSFPWLFQDILFALDNKKLSLKPFAPQVTPLIRLPFFTKMIMELMTKKWEKTGKIFSKIEFEAMFATYWKGHHSHYEKVVLQGDAYQNVIRKAHKAGVTVNNLLSVAFLRAFEGNEITMAASYRNEGNQSMGNWTSGIKVMMNYREQKGMEVNARKFAQLSKKKLEDPKRFYHFLSFLQGMPPTLVDSLSYCSVMGYDEKAALRLTKLLGYDKPDESMVSLTNLGILPIATKEGKYQIEDFVFIPPLPLNARRVIGVSSLEDRMSIVLHVDVENAVTDVQAFDKAIDILKNDND